jgi:hypothetical protein
MCFRLGKFAVGLAFGLPSPWVSVRDEKYLIAVYSILPQGSEW